MAEAFTTQIEEHKRGLAEKILGDSFPLVVTTYNKGVLFLTPSPLHTLFKKVREVFPGIVLAGIGEVATLNNYFQQAVNIAYYQELMFSPEDTNVNRIVLQLSAMLGNIFNDARLRPAVVGFILVSLKPTPCIFTLSYDGSIKEDSDYAVLSSGNRQEELIQQFGSLFDPGMTLEEAAQNYLRIFTPQKEHLEVAILNLKEDGTIEFLNAIREEV